MSQYLTVQLQEKYSSIEKIEKEEGTLIVFADDDTLWKILEDLRDEFSMEFEAGAGEEHYIRIIT